MDGEISVENLAESDVPVGVLEHEAEGSTAGPNGEKHTRHEAVGKEQEISGTLRVPA